MLSLSAHIAIGPAQASQQLDDTVTSHLAMMRCWVSTGFGDKEFNAAYTEHEIRRFKSYGTKYNDSAEQVETALSAQRNGVSKRDYERIMDNW